VKVGDLVKINDKYKHDSGASRVVGIVVDMERGANDRCQVLWVNGFSSVPLCEILDIISKHKKDKIN
jgi:hypothetical protein